MNFAPEMSVKKVMSLEEMIERLAERIEKAVSLTFGDFAKAGADRRELAIGFLALLELVKRGLILAKQESSFGVITMDYNGTVRAPKYD
jgi:chromatin segregation and condensation protein Rec8/ScpA/Scc1 (kleisin family)